MSAKDTPQSQFTRKLKLFPHRKSSNPNGISTLKYTILSFFPRVLLFKVTAFPIPYFIFYFALLNIHDVTISEEPFFFLGLIVLILLIHMIKEGLSERIRHKWSQKINKTKCHVYDPVERKFVETEAAAVHLGDVVKMTKEITVPADVILIYHDLHETCKVAHDDLDGDTMLKTKKTVSRVSRVLRNSTMIGNNMPNIQLLEGIAIKYEEPNPYYHNFNADITFLGVKSTLDDSHFIPRGANIRSSGFALGIVVYVGQDSKLMQNIHRAKTKSPSIENEAYGHLRFILILHSILATICAIYDIVWFRVNEDELGYIHPPGTEPVNYAREFFITIGRWLLLIVEIPTSLLIHLELMRAYQAHLLQKHYLLNPEPNGPSNVLVNNDSVLEEIGRVQYLVLDKTYILTPSKWRIKEIVTGSQEYDFKPVRPSRASSMVTYPNANFDTVLSNQDSKNYKSLTKAMCWSTVGLNIGKNVLSMTDQAILDFAGSNGFNLEKRLNNDNDTFLVGCPKEVKEITLLATIEEEQGTNFLLKDNASEKIILFCIGTLDYLFPYIEGSADPKVKAKVESFTNERFKTIFFASTTLEDEECNSLIEKHRSTGSNENGSVQAYFKDMTLLCAAGIGESRHPDSQSIVEFMYKTGVNIWLLSGDNRDALISSAYLTRIFPIESPHLTFISSEIAQLKKDIEEKEKNIDSYKNHYLLLSGVAVAQLEEAQDLMCKLVKLASKCQGVIGYGISPRQKQTLVKCLKKVQPKKVTLALGKGPKDIPMMTEAHVAIGVQKSYSLNVADFIITKMYDIKVIMYIYGREYYRKNSVLFQYIIYRGMYISLATFFWGINSAFVGNPLFSHFLLTFFEMMFTSIPITVFCLYDRKRTDQELLNNPELYHNARNNRYFNHKTFYLWKINGGVQGFWIWLFLCYFTDQNFTSSSGWTSGYWVIAHMAFWLNIIAVNFLLLVYSSRINIALVFSAIIACALFVAFWAIESSDAHSDSFGTMEMSWGMPTLYMASVLVIVCSFVPIMAAQRYYKITREIKKKRNSNNNNNAN